MRLLDRLGRLPLVIVVGWIVAAGLAVLVGVVGIGLVGAGLTTRPGAPLSEDDVRRALEEIGDSPAPAVSPSPSSTTPVVRGHSLATPGGTVVADCAGIRSLSPAQGFRVHDQDDDEGEFRGVRDEHIRVKVELIGCEQGVPRLTVTRESDDD